MTLPAPLRTFAVIPAVDLRAGRCVRLVQGDPARERVYSDDPVAVARTWAQRGAPWLHVVDLDGAFAGRPVHRDLIEAIARAVLVPVQAGGGVRTLEDVERLLAAGVARVVLGTAALALAPAVAGRFGERVVAALDVRGGRTMVDGWRAAGDDPLDLARRLVDAGIRRFIYTAVSRDGTLTGPDVEAVGAFCRTVQVPVLAAGGVGRPADLAALAEAGAAGAIVGRALYEGRVDLMAVGTGTATGGSAW